jgi:hypothetical protein
MAKLIKEFNSLYCGTTERVAKLTPVVGLNPTGKPIYLSAVYPGLLAFYASTNDQDRFGIVEVDLAYLDGSNFQPAEWYLAQTSRQKPKTGREQQRRLEALRKELAKHKAKWRESLQKIGVCVYDGFVPKKAIRRITVYDPASNPTITQAIVGSSISLSEFKKGHYRNQVVTRWLTGESISVDEWLGEDLVATPKEEREKLAESLQDKSGLDVFYHEPPPKGS